MAGIGFRLQKLLEGESYADLIKAYFYSSIISTGPMLIVIVTLGVVKWIMQQQLSLEEGNLFMGLVIYSFAFSMIGTAPFLYIVTRFLADHYYLKEIEVFTPAYLACLGLNFLLQGIAVAFFLYFLPVTPLLKGLSWFLYLSITGIWIAMIFLSAARNYLAIVFAFLIGAFIGMALALGLGAAKGLPGFLFGFTVGQGLTFLILTFRIFREFGFSYAVDFDFLSYLRHHPFLFLTGIFYYVGIWVDKIIFWFSPHGEKIVGGIYVFSTYDTPMFLAFLTIVPSMAFFLIQMETSFVKRYVAYYQSIRRREDFFRLEQKKEAIFENLSAQFQKFVLFQGCLSGVVILFIYNVAEAVHLNPLQTGILRIGILGAFLQMGFLMVLNILFYFDFQKEACALTALFALCNGLFTFISLKIGLPAYGFGFALACFTVVMAGFLIMDTKLKSLSYWTFMRQPILLPKFKFEKEEIGITSTIPTEQKD